MLPEDEIETTGATATFGLPNGDKFLPARRPDDDKHLSDYRAFPGALGDDRRCNEVVEERPDGPAGRSNNLALLGELVRKFAYEREWEKYHNPRSLILALMGELGEIAELFQWRTDGEASELMQDSELAARVTEELADVFSYLLRLADVTGVDLGKALEAKIRLNEERYPAHLARGNSRKYTELGGYGD